MRRVPILTTGILASVLVAGCVTNIGSRAVRPARFNYNQAIANSHDEQMLLNLVRLRYRDTLQYLSVGSVLTQYTFAGGASVSADGFIDTSAAAGASVSYSERPTITYTPLQGEDFARRMLTPVPPEGLILLAQSGWSIERLALCCVEQMNELRNAPSASGPTPDYTPTYAEFKTVARLLRELQVAGLVDLRLEHAAEDDQERTRIYLQTRPSGDWANKVNQIRTLLDLPQERDNFQLTSRMSGEADEISIRSRSVYGMLSYLSQAVMPPPEHKAAGLVTVTPNQGGGELDWTEVTGHLFQVRSQPDRPENAFVAIYYRDNWFYIADDDLESKTTFGLVTILFALQAAPSEGGSPLLTVNTGR